MPDLNDIKKDIIQQINVLQNDLAIILMIEAKYSDIKPIIENKGIEGKAFHINQLGLKGVSSEYLCDTYGESFNDECLKKIFELRFANSYCKCGGEVFTKVKGRMSYQCRKCGFQVYPCAGTIFEKTTQPLFTWFFAIWLYVNEGANATRLSSDLDVSYKTALRMLHLIKGELKYTFNKVTLINEREYNKR